MASIRYLGHSCFEIELGGRIIITDPWLQLDYPEMPRLIPPAVSANAIRKADLILVSHEHFDHCSAYDVETIVSRTSAHVLAPAPAMALLNVPTRCKMQVEEGEEFSLFGVDVRVVKAVHPQSANPVGFVLSSGGESAYFAGDTYEYFGMSGISVDVALIPIGGSYTMDVLSAIKALKTMRAKKVVPMHFNTFQKIECNVTDFAARVKTATRVEPLVLRVGESISFK